MCSRAADHPKAACGWVTHTKGSFPLCYQHRPVTQRARLRPLARGAYREGGREGGERGRLGVPIRTAPEQQQQVNGCGTVRCYCTMTTTQNTTHTHCVVVVHSCKAAALITNDLILRGLTHIHRHTSVALSQCCAVCCVCVSVSVSLSGVILLHRQLCLLGAARVGAQHPLVLRVCLVHCTQLDLIGPQLKARTTLQYMQHVDAAAAAEQKTFGFCVCV